MPCASSFSSVAAILAALCLGGSAVSQTGSPQSPPIAEDPEDSVGFNQVYPERMTVPVRIDGKGPYSFIVDTGAERTIVSNELAERLALGPGKSVRLHSMTGASNVQTAVIQTLELSRQSVSDIQAPVLRERHIGASGILGIDTLQSQRIDFDFVQQKMSITRSRPAVASYGADTIVVTARRRLGRLILVDAAIEGEKLTVILDTGSDLTIGNEALKRKLMATQKLKTPVPVELMSVTGGKIMVDYTQVDRVRLGRVFVDQMPIGFADVHPFAQLGLSDRPAILLGMDTLELFSRVSVDFARKRVHLLVPDSARRGMRVADASRYEIR